MSASDAAAAASSSSDDNDTDSSSSSVDEKTANSAFLPFEGQSQPENEGVAGASSAGAAESASTSSSDPVSAPGKKYYAVDFDFGEVLGEGAFGAVMRVKLKDTGKEYAIKVMDKKHIMKEDKVKYVKTERNILSMCHHPNIVSLFCTFSDPGHLYYVIELCPNGELLTWLKRFGPLSLPCTRFYIAELVSALEFLHQHNVIHRDLKPENLLLSDTMHLKLTDFGTSKELQGAETLARSNSFVGTAEYVCPELLSVKENSAASDLWALGVIIYQMLTNRLAFHGSTQYLTFQNVLHRKFAWPQQPMDPDARDLIENLLQLEPSARLGVGLGGYDKLKAHPFFTGIDWTSLSQTTPPPFESSGIVWTWESDATASSSGAAGGDHQAADSSSAQQSTGGSDEHQQQQQQQQQQAYDTKATQDFGKHLNKDEKVLKAGTIWKRRKLSVKKRTLLLTSTPRLVYIDPRSDETKGEIPFSEDMKVEIKSKKGFLIKTPGRNWILEDSNKNAQLWVSAIKLQLAKLSHK